MARLTDFHRQQRTKFVLHFILFSNIDVRRYLRIIYTPAGILLVYTYMHKVATYQTPFFGIYGVLHSFDSVWLFFHSFFFPFSCIIFLHVI
jgi:hypothetical protein